MKRSRSNSKTAPHPTTRSRLGLCYKFARKPIKFRTTTATAMFRLSRPERLAHLAELCLANAAALFASRHDCAAQEIGAFRINRQMMPVKTHPQAGYDIRKPPRGNEIELLDRIGRVGWRGHHQSPRRWRLR